MLIIDTGATVDGYYCDFDRNFCIARADDATRRAHDKVYEATEAGILAARPGVTAGGVWRAMADRLGHPDDATVLQPGMVITIEPGIAYAEADGGSWCMRKTSSSPKPRRSCCRPARSAGCRSWGTEAAPGHQRKT